MEIIACPNCGSRRIYQGSLGDGVLTGYTSRNVCRDCGYQGMPIFFDDEIEYQKFLKRKSLEKKTKVDKNKEIKNVKTTKVIKRPIGVGILSFIMILQAVLSIYLYYTLARAHIPLGLWIYYITIFVISAIILPYGLLKGKSWAWTLAGILFALSIPIGLVFLYYLTRPHVKSFFGKSE